MGSVLRSVVGSRSYLDASAVAPLHPAAREALLAALDDGWADPRRLHAEGRRARALLDGAREAIAAALGVRTEELHLTGSHVQAVDAAVLGTVRARRRAGPAVVVTAVEHSSVLHAARFAAGEATRLVPVDRLGRVDAEQFVARAGEAGVALAGLQFANAEVGTTQPVGEVAGALAASSTARVPLLVDLTGAAGHLDVGTCPGDLLVADPASWGAGPGIGVLAVRAGTRWEPPGPARDGPEVVPGAVPVPAALAAAVSLEALRERPRDAERRALVDRIRSAAAAIPDTEVHGDGARRLPHVVTFSCLYVDGEVLLGALDRLGFAVGSGSACTASTLEPSHVLAAMGVLSHGNVRVGLPVTVTEDEVDRFLAALPEAVASVREQLGVPGL